jgi:hypothetical protein
MAQAPLSVQSNGIFNSFANERSTRSRRVLEAIFGEINLVSALKLAAKIILAGKRDGWALCGEA